MGNWDPAIEAGSYIVASEFLYEFNARDPKLRKRLLYKLARHRFAAGECNMRTMRGEIGVEHFHPVHKVQVHRLTMALPLIV
jgi:hypothetical protein